MIQIMLWNIYLIYRSAIPTKCQKRFNNPKLLQKSTSQLLSNIHKSFQNFFTI